MKNLLVIDGSALLNIIFFASISGQISDYKDVDAINDFVKANFRHGNTHCTENVSAFVSKVCSLKDELKADYVVVCFDKNSNTTFRKLQHPSYKDNRTKRPEAIKDEMLVLHCLLNNIGIKCYWSDFYEADDLAGSIINRFKSEVDNVYFFTKDRDWLQLISNNVKGIYPLDKEEKAIALRNYSNIDENNVFTNHNNPKALNRNICIDTNLCETFFGVYPDEVVDFKALAGDKSDNILGVKGIGTETARGLIATFGTLENIYKALKENDKDGFKSLIKALIKRNPYDNLVNGEQDAYESKALATIETSLNIPFQLESLAWNINVDILKQGIKIYNLDSNLLSWLSLGNETAYRN